MNVQELAYWEEDLYREVIILCDKPVSDDNTKKLEEINNSYKKIHSEYAKFSSNNIEALKRGLFIQWYAMTEPSFLTGIGLLDEISMIEILDNVNHLTKLEKVDDELIWMLNYYWNWDFAFQTVKTFNGFDKKIVNEENNKLPRQIHRDIMKQRGQMGRYWLSLDHFKIE